MKSKSQAALKAWQTIREKRLERIRRENRQLEFYLFDINPAKVSYGSYRINPPLIKPSRLTSVERGGVGKELSDGWAINYAIGCTHACRFCYVDNIRKRFSGKVSELVYRPWGMYLLIPKNIDEAIERTEWSRWRGQEVMMCSTHDPYLPELYQITRKILEKSLPYGVKYLIQTRSILVKRDFELLVKYRDQVKVQVSIASMNETFARRIEPRVPSPKARFNILKEAKNVGLKTGLILAPVFPKKDWRKDMEQMIEKAAEIGIDQIYGESFHVRGPNLDYMREALSNYEVKLDDFLSALRSFDVSAGRWFNALLRAHNLKGRWWYEYENP